jgi:cytochrome c556
MRKFGLLLLAAVAALGVSALAANEKPPTEFQDAMKSNGAINGAMGLPAHIKAQDYDAIAMDAVTLKGNFAKAEAFFTMKKVPAAVDIAIAAGKAATDLGAAARAKNDAAIEAARAAVTPNCGGCHKQFREQLPDKTYEIKVP